MSKLILINSGGSYTVEEVTAVPVTDAGSPVQASSARNLVLINSAGTYTLPLAASVSFAGSAEAVAAVSYQDTIEGPTTYFGKVEVVAESSYTQVFGGSYRYPGSVEAVAQLSHVLSRISGRSLIIWPFKPEVDFIETLEWKTEVIRAKAAEQRIALRKVPRRQYALEHFFTSKAYSNARILMRLAVGFLVPDWTMGNAVANVTPGMGVAIAFPTADLGLAVGSKMVMWQSPTSYQVIKVQSFDAAGIVADQVTTGMDRARVYPLLAAICPRGLSIRRMTNDLATGSTDMEIVENPYIGASVYPQYRGHDIMPDRPLTTSGSINESVSWPNEIIDNDLGLQVMIAERNSPDDQFTLSWEIDDRDILVSFRQWLHSRFGKQKAFWASSWAQDLDLAAAIGAAHGSITVYTPPGVSSLWMTTFDIDIATAAGVHYYVQITDADPGTPVGGLPTLSLTLATAIGVNLALADVDRISFLRCARFNSDRVELRHQGGDVCNITIPCIEVPVP